jgi:hypothetical protein
MQQLRGRGWVKGFELPPARALVGRLLQKRWIEGRGAGRGLEYRITEEGMRAKKARIPESDGRELRLPFCLRKPTLPDRAAMFGKCQMRN